MKYIRTKDGKIVELKPHRFYKYVLKGKSLYLSGKGEYLYINNVVSQSDTIEELCDDYFAISNTDYKAPIKIDFEKKIIYQWQSNRLVVNYTFEQFIPYHTIYGAIWIDKGLIYVAKMNGKGELELL